MVFKTTSFIRNIIEEEKVSNAYSAQDKINFHLNQIDFQKCNDKNSIEHDSLISLFVTINTTNEEKLNWLIPIINNQSLSSNFWVDCFKQLMIEGRNPNPIIFNFLCQTLPIQNFSEVNKKYILEFSLENNIYFLDSLLKNGIDHQHNYQLFHNCIEQFQFNKASSFLHYDNQISINELDSTGQTIFDQIIKQYESQKIIYDMFNNKRNKEKLDNIFNRIQNEAIPFLNKNGFNYNLENDQRQTSLRLAIAYDYYDIASILMSQNINLDHVHHDGLGFQDLVYHYTNQTSAMVQNHLDKKLLSQYNNNKKSKKQQNQNIL